jgi:hypothetical protein
MFAIDYPHRVASAPGNMKHAMKYSNITSRSPRIADFQSAHAEAPRPVRKNRLRIGKPDAFSDQKRHYFGASTCSTLSSAACAEQNHLREKIEKIAKSKNRVQPGSAPHGIASL